MKAATGQLNLLLAWLWILLGFVSGAVLGLFFHRENWLGGYASFQRRMYRLAHISFFGLGVVNFIFALTLKNFPADGALAQTASWSFIAGAIAMPLCCVMMAHFPKVHFIFAVPVVSLILGGVLTLAQLAEEPKATDTANPIALTVNPQPSTSLPP
jgi:uncharacterized membrane protein YdcZ (DUF606 family)